MATADPSASPQVQRQSVVVGAGARAAATLPCTPISGSEVSSREIMEYTIGGIKQHDDFITKLREKLAKRKKDRSGSIEVEEVKYGNLSVPVLPNLDDLVPGNRKKTLRPRLGKPGTTWNRPQNPSRAESSPRVGELSLPAQNRIWLHRFCILAHVNPLENTGVFHRTTARRARLPRELLALVFFRATVRRFSRAAAGEPHHAGRVCQAAVTAATAAAAADSRFGSSRRGGGGLGSPIRLYLASDEIQVTRAVFVASGLLPIVFGISEEVLCWLY